MIRAMKVGVISDTHGLLRPRVPELLAGCDAILHAGDVGDPDILDQLAAIAPLTVVRGNVDTSGRLAGLDDRVSGTLGDGERVVRFRMTHRRDDVEAGWVDGSDLLVFGHSHRPEIAWHGSCLLLNPGACGQRRFRLPLTLALLDITADGRIVPELRSVEA